jgi:hypothetical protein
MISWKFFNIKYWQLDNIFTGDGRQNHKVLPDIRMFFFRIQILRKSGHGVSKGSEFILKLE